MRTEQGAPQQSTISGKWSATFVTYNGQPGNEYVANQCTTAPLFATEDEAVAAGDRALSALEESGRFPNMCIPF